ncbi:MAG: alpha-E domain-containing protein [Rhizobiaceae bacterium]
MILGRTANGLYWMHRYIERAENMARLIDAGMRMALTRTAGSPDEWSSVVLSAGAKDTYTAAHESYTAEKVVHFLLCDPTNASSVTSSITAARQNARMVRTALTREAWEAVNMAWMSMTRALANPIPDNELPQVLDLIKRETALIRGAFHGTMLRNEIFNFSNLGTYVERADNTARILDVKYYVLLPSISYVGSAMDTSQWESILRSVSAHRSYRWEYEAEYKPANIADYLILNDRMPRSLAFCYHNLAVNLGYLDHDYAMSTPAYALASETKAMLRGNTVAKIIDSGLHEFLFEFINQNNRLGMAISEAYNFD